MENRRDIVYELATWSHGAEEVLQTWSRQDILQILCSEMGKERKYTGVTKLKMIEHLLKVVSEKNSGNHENVVSERPPSPSPSTSQKRSKRTRKPENLSRLVVSSSATNISACITDSNPRSEIYCKNSACKARLNNRDMFCKRCTCCVCHKYDDNKDPSLWLTCSSEPPFPGDSCNMSCHLECAIKHVKSGIARSKLDGDFYCLSCGKMNDLMRCWRKQVMVAKETRRVDILCYRISLSQKLLSGTKKYQKLSNIIDDAVRMLEAEVGTLSDGAVQMGRGIVNRLSSGQEVQSLCASAFDLFDSVVRPTPLHQDSKTTSPSSLSNPSSVEDETTTITTTCCDLTENKTENYFDYYKADQKIDDPNSSNEPLNSTSASQDQNPSSGSDEEQAVITVDGSNDKPVQLLPITPARTEIFKDGVTKKGRSKPVSRAQDGIITKKRRLETQDEECARDSPAEKTLEYYVKVIRWLECEGHMDKSFRQKFLTWYSINATPQETRIVKAFVDTLIEDPVSLSEQLVDTFGETVSSNRSSDVPHGVCLKFWH